MKLPIMNPAKKIIKMNKYVGNVITKGKGSRSNFSCSLLLIEKIEMIRKMGIKTNQKRLFKLPFPKRLIY